MSEDIKEILYVLKRIIIGRASRLTPREADKLLDYITNLQEENEHTNYCNEQLKKKITNLEYKINTFEDYKSRNEKTTNKIELLLKDLKDMQKLEKETGKEHFTLELFAIRIKEIYKLLQGSDKE